MEKPPSDLGKDLLIAIDDTPGSLDMIKAASCQLPDPQHTEVTLIHYLAPVYWEYGGDSPETASYLAEQAREKEDEEEALTLKYFSSARRALQEAGLSERHIHTKENWRANSVMEAVLSELRAGTYSGVIIGQDHHNTLARLLHLDLAHALQRHTDGIVVWVIDAPSD
jgi:hypothetical protein